MKSSLFTLFLVIAVLGASATVHAARDETVLPVEQAFGVETSATARDAIRIDFKIARDYYLARESIKITTGDAGVALEAPQLPVGEKKHDEFLGDVETYHRDFSATQKLSAPANAAAIDLALRFQGCHEVEPKICFPPRTLRLKVALPALTDGASSTLPPAADANPLASLASATGVQPGPLGIGEPLPAGKAFVFEAIAGDDNAILARFTMPKGYYLYRDKTVFELPADSGVDIVETRWPAGVQHEDANFGASMVYFDQVDVPLRLHRRDGASTHVALTTRFQGCLEGSVCYPQMTRTLDVALPAGSVSAAGERASSELATTSPPTPATTAQPRPSPSALALPWVLLLALAGGVILNLMPCVFPVLSLKAVSLARSGESHATAQRHVLYYTAGVLVAFALVGLTAIALKHAGLAYGWGFQLQQPLFVALLAYLMLAIGLSLSGVVQFGAGITQVGQKLTERSGPLGDFFTGVLACVVASPCTTPFMGSALAYAFSASMFAALGVFLAIGLGLALPFLVIGFVPALAQRLPRPGAWMETFKQAMAFPMYLTAAWLAWILGNQRGVDAVGLLLAGAVVLALGLWWFECSRFRGAWRLAALAVVFASLAPLYILSQFSRVQNAVATTASQTPFNPARLAELRRAGTPVFVDIGADWCMTCKANEHAVLDTSSFKALLEKTHAMLMVGDWTNPDRDIEAFLAQYHAVGVPLYVVFRAGREGEVLPTVLTPQSVREALDPAPSATSAVGAN